MKHGLAHKTPLYNVWKMMRQRCSPTNKSVEIYKNYAGRGIKVAPEWNDFQQFFTDMTFGYRKGLTLERVDNSKGYSKANCRWATRDEQSVNKRNNVMLTFDGKTMAMGRWAKELGLNPQTLHMRVRVYKWPISKALSSKKYA